MLVAEKEKLRKEWEECFDEKLDEHLTVKGMEKFYSPETSLEEAANMLTKAAVIMLFNDIGIKFPEGKTSVIIINGDDEPCEGKASKPFIVLENGEAVDERFESIEDAEEYIKKICMSSTRMRDNFKIVQEM